MHHGNEREEKYEPKCYIQEDRGGRLESTLTPPISSTETESTYPRSSGFGWLSFSCCHIK